MKKYAAFVVLGLALAACSSNSGEADSKTVSDTPSTEATTEHPSSEPPDETTTSSSPVLSTLKVGDTYTTAYADVTVFAVNADAAPGAPAPESPDTRWSGADVQVCAKQAISVSWSPWSLIGSDNGNYPAASIGYDQFPKPEYPFVGMELAPGECVRGWIIFDTAISATISAVKWAPSADDVKPMRWTV